MTSITSGELNFLVFRYLQESGFEHAAFALGHETSIDKCPIDGSSVPPGALITFVQKGLQYVEMEANLSNADSDADEDFSFLQPLDLITKDVNELRRTIRERRKKEAKTAKENELDRKISKKREREKNPEKIEEKRREKEHVKAVETNHA